MRTTIDDIERINDHREHWQLKLDAQIDELKWLSLAGDKQKYDALLYDIGTTTDILWEFDRKLEYVLNDGETERSSGR